MSDAWLHIVGIGEDGMAGLVPATRAIVEAGHDLQNHTWSHPACSFWAAPPACARHEITAANNAIRQVAAPPPRYFRAPAGLTNPFVHSAAAQAGLRIAGW